MNWNALNYLSLGLLLFGLAACASDQESSQTASETDKPSSPSSTPAAADSLDFVAYSDDAVMGEAVYVPVYSHIYQQSHRKTFNLTATLSIRNTDLESSMTISKVYYYDSAGNLVQKYLDQPRTVKPLSSISFVVEEKDLRGGVGANFLVLWEAARPVNKPIIEAVMISTSQQQGISFVSRGKVIDSL